MLFQFDKFLLDTDRRELRGGDRGVIRTPAGTLDAHTGLPDPEFGDKGIVDLKDVVFFLSLIGATLFLNAVALER